MFGIHNKIHKNLLNLFLIQKHLRYRWIIIFGNLNIVQACMLLNEIQDIFHGLHQLASGLRSHLHAGSAGITLSPAELGRLGDVSLDRFQGLPPLLLIKFEAGDRIHHHIPRIAERSEHLDGVIQLGAGEDGRQFGAELLLLGGEELVPLLLKLAPRAAGCPPGVDADLDGDGDVDLDDYAILAANFTGAM